MITVTLKTLFRRRDYVTVNMWGTDTVDVLKRHADGWVKIMTSDERTFDVPAKELRTVKRYRD